MPTYDIHPFMKDFVASTLDGLIPNQRLTWKEKHKNKDKLGISAWMKSNMDFGEQIARFQRRRNFRLLQNERLVNGEMISSINPQDFCEDCEEDFNDVINKLGEDLDVEGLELRNYDIIGVPIRQQVSEFAQRPDTLVVSGMGEPLESDRFTVQKDLTLKWAMEQIELNIAQTLKDRGIDPEQEVDSEEQQQQLEAAIEQVRKEKTPEEIGQYMQYDYRHYFEEWATYEVADQIERHKLRKMRREEYKDFLSVGRRFRFLNVNPNGLSIERLHYADLYFHKNNYSQYPQYGDYQGIITLETAASINNKWGHLLTEEQQRSLEPYNDFWEPKQARANTDFWGNKVDYLDTDGLPFNQYLPSVSPLLNRIAPNMGINWVSPLSDVFGGSNKKLDEFYVIEHFWRSFTQVGRLAWTNPSTGIYEVLEVDETFVVPANIKVLKKGKFSDEVEPNTLIWAWKEELWQGKKISKYNMVSDFGAIYFDVRPMDYQGGKYRYKNKPLPIVGQISGSTSVESLSQVDILKPFAYAYNLLMNKAVKMISLTYSTFLAIDPRNIPNNKDWGGEDGFIRWMETGQATTVAPVDTSLSTASGSSSTMFPREINIDNSNKALAALNMAIQVKQIALAQIGITPQRMGEVVGVNTATALQEGLAKSFTATESWFTEYWEAEAEIMYQQLQIAQWLQSKERDFDSLISKGIISQSILLNNTEDFDLYDLRIYIGDSQEKLRQLDLYQKLALDNTTDASMSTRMAMSSSNNAQQILNIVKAEEDKAMQRQQQMQEMQQQLAQEQEETKRMEIQTNYQMHLEKLENDLKKAWIVSRGFQDEASQDADNSGIPDAFEYEKFNQKSSNDLAKIGLTKDKMAFEREKEMNRRVEKQQEMMLKQTDINQKLESSRLANDSAKYLDKGKRKS